jgi:hypothetical protein
MKNIQTVCLVLTATFFCLLTAGAQDIEQKLPAICITGVMSDANNSLVVINDEIVRVGDEIHGIKIISAVQSTVTLEYNGKTFEKRIGEGCLKISAPVSQAQGVNGKAKAKAKINPFAAFSSKTKVTNKEGLERIFFIYGTIFIIILWILTLLSYVYGALCLHKIANKTITKYGWLAWIPLANLFLMLMIARRPLLWSLLFFVPLVNFIFLIILWMEIAKLRNKPAWLGVLMILPFVNLVILGYLAFSK